MKKIKIHHLIIAILISIILITAIFNIGCITKGYIIFRHDDLANFGTFYGGILGTIIAIFGIYYIIKTYHIQQRQFETVQTDADFNIINNLFDKLSNEINSVQYRRKNSSKPGDYTVFNGIDAFYNFDKNHWNNPNAVLNHLQSILIDFEHIIYLTKNKIKFKNSNLKDLTLTRIYFLYFKKIIWPVYDKIYRYEKDELIKRKHSGINELIKKYEDLIKESYNFLLDKNYVSKPSESDILKLLK